MFPEFKWNKWQFEKVPNNIWKDPQAIRSLLDHVAKELGVKEYSDWYNVQVKVSFHRIDSSFNMLKDLNQYGFRFKSYMLPQLLSLAYPEHAWSFKNKVTNAYNKKSQFVLKTCLKSLFPKEGITAMCFEDLINKLEILEDYRPSDLESAEGRFLELDFFYPKFKLAVEYQVYHL